MIPTTPMAPLSTGHGPASGVERIRPALGAIIALWTLLVIGICGVAAAAVAGRGVEELLCDLGDARACANLGDVYLAQSEAWQRPDRAARAAHFFHKACDDGIHASCNELGVLSDRGAGVQKDPGRAAALFLRACDAGHVLACANLGLAFVRGAGVDKDVARGLRHLTRACNADEPRACTQLGLLYRRGTDVERDDARAAGSCRRVAMAGSAALAAVSRSSTPAARV